MDLSIVTISIGKGRRPDAYKELAKALERKGWSISRIRGSHHVDMKADHRERIVIPMHGSKPLKIGLLKAQMKIAGLTEEDL